MRSIGVVLVAVGLSSGCRDLQEVPQPPFQVVVSVTADKDVPLPEAVIQRNNEPIAKTDGTGKALVTFKGAEGDQIDVYVKCPEGFDSPTKPTTILLRRLSGDSKKMAEYQASCPPAERKVVVAVRSENGNNLPVKYLNKDVARTDAWGTATFMVTGKPGDHMDFTLDTSDKGNENLRPQNPIVSVVVENKDNYYSYDAPFQVVKPKIVVVAPHRPQPIGPTPLRY